MTKTTQDTIFSHKEMWTNWGHRVRSSLSAGNSDGLWALKNAEDCSVCCLYCNKIEERQIRALIELKKKQLKYNRLLKTARTRQILYSTTILYVYCTFNRIRQTYWPKDKSTIEYWLFLIFHVDIYSPTIVANIGNVIETFGFLHRKRRVWALKYLSLSLSRMWEAK